MINSKNARIVHWFIRIMLDSLESHERALIRIHHKVPRIDIDNKSAKFIKESFNDWRFWRLELSFHRNSLIFTNIIMSKSINDAKNKYLLTLP